MPPGRLDVIDKPATTQSATAAVALASRSSQCGDLAVAVAGAGSGVHAPPATSSATTGAAPEAAAAVGCAAASGSTFDDVCVLKRACVVASLRRYVEQWDGSDQVSAEAMLVGFLKYDGPLELGTTVPRILNKVNIVERGDRILDRLGAHTFGMDPVLHVRPNVWWSAGDGEFMVGPVGMAAFGLAPTWVEKLLSHLRAGGRLGELSNEVAIVASALSVVGVYATSFKVERLTKILRMLLAAGCDVNSKAGGLTALAYLASALTREEVDDEVETQLCAPASEVDALLAPLCVLLVEHGARFDVCGDYGRGHRFNAARKYRGWTPPTGTKSNDSITPPHPMATATEIFMARGWQLCVDAVLQMRAKPSADGGCVCGGGS